ncbi:hypothetical protein DI09_15p220 [Mitosporidium daphniae]|uniref:Uncharacterized protein n=1 Tax=Mitosporidium daphniae TaxID=1485682 RepID=A0A098VUC2_9MICR|nr:uncharacterized protein DI09_15p220 [Mitosporidium daphniae]KGG52555.1 hypothetical protein DI09_15p220 [Mitosporidium daphniae]|eukprot:XP_013238982.1 uncharacterized protein DI09_15p220 [Mitosporidium daphniae]
MDHHCEDPFARFKGTSRAYHKVGVFIFNRSSVQDNFYGDLLLVTCGSMLPSWVKSDEISMNRTFISAGKFHFISKELISSKKRVPLKDALAAVSSPMTITSMNREMCSILDNLLASSDVYLDSILQSGKRLYPIALPRKIAGILLENPSLIAVTCDTYNSNVHKVSVKEFSKITKQHQSYFEPEEPVKVLLPLTKKCFALLDSQQLPLYISESQDLSSTLGTKLAWGYMILLEYIDKNSGDSNFTAPFSANIEEAVKYARLHLDQQVSTKEALDALRYLESPIIVDSNLIQKSLSDGKFACLNESGDMELQLWDAFSEDELRSLIYGPTHMQESVAENQAGEDEDGDDFFFTSDEENSDGLDCNQEYDEFEVLDTLLRDPELLMKVIERYSASGESSKDLLSKLSKLKIEQVQEHTPSADEIPNSEDSDSQLSSNDDAFSE